jgi:hypothetical protein
LPYIKSSNRVYTNLQVIISIGRWQCIKYSRNTATFFTPTRSCIKPTREEGERERKRENSQNTGNHERRVKEREKEKTVTARVAITTEEWKRERVKKKASTRIFTKEEKSESKTSAVVDPLKPPKKDEEQTERDGERVCERQEKVLFLLYRYQTHFAPSLIDPRSLVCYGCLFSFLRLFCVFFLNCFVAPWLLRRPRSMNPMSDPIESGRIRPSDEIR